MTPEKEDQRGHQAKAILEDALYREAFDTVRSEIETQWRNSPARDAEGREKLWLSSKILDRLEQHLASVMESGKLARATIAHRIGKSATGF
ncbi:MAG TPA: hypothetical protein VM621_10580 [Luteibacter sp.]|uniref:hypothetical protein n=1 Tax=Luteibacter sp. TaxID=1886636 RepID=UPI002C636F2A|nr:hypothetical protein [Luteibacter sp.]HVI55482.1 hypothetical protein [Luteibacter sp.]